MKLPEIPATNTVMAGVGAAIAVLLVIAVVGSFTVDSSGPGKKSATTATTTGQPAAVSKGSASKGTAGADPCALVTSKEASAAFGSDAGAAHLVLGACLYDDGTHKLIVSITHDNAKTQFDASKGPASSAVAGIGDSAYVLDGRLRVLKGSTMMLITLAPADPAHNPALVTLGKAAAPRL